MLLLFPSSSSFFLSFAVEASVASRLCVKFLLSVENAGG